MLYCKLLFFQFVNILRRRIKWALLWNVSLLNEDYDQRLLDTLCPKDVTKQIFGDNV